MLLGALAILMIFGYRRMLLLIRLERCNRCIFSGFLDGGVLYLGRG